MEYEYVDKLSMTLDDIIKMKLLDKKPGTSDLSRSRSRDRRSRSRSCSRARSISLRRPDSLNQNYEHRSRSRSRNNHHSKRATSSIRSGQQWRLERGWIDRQRSVSRNRSFSRQFSRSVSRERSASQCSYRSGSQYSFSSGRNVNQSSYRNRMQFPLMLSLPSTHCKCCPYQCFSMYRQKPYIANLPKYVQARNQPQANIWRQKFSPGYPVYRHPVSKRIIARQQLRIAQQLVRNAKRVLNAKCQLYYKPQLYGRKPLVNCSVVPQHKSRNKQKSPIMTAVQQNNCHFYHPQERQNVDIIKCLKGTLSITFDNELATRNSHSLHDPSQRTSYPAEQSEEGQELKFAEEMCLSSGLKRNDCEPRSPCVTNQIIGNHFF